MTRAPFFGSKPSSMQRLSLAFPPASFAPSSLMASQFTTHTASACTTKIALFSFSSWSGASSKDLSNPCPLSVQGSRHFCIAAALGAGSSACRGRGRCRFSLLQLLCSLLPDSRKQWPAGVFMVTGFRRIQWPDPWYTAVHHLLPGCLPLPLSLIPNSTATRNPCPCEQ